MVRACAGGMLCEWGLTFAGGSDGDLTGRSGRSRQIVRGETKGADKVRGVRRVRGKSVVGERLEGIRVDKARKLRTKGQRWLRRGFEMRFEGALGEDRVQT